MTRFDVPFQGRSWCRFLPAYESPVVRTFTFAGLIILVGFVAALPFKKAPTAGTAQSDATLATGPSTDLAISESAVSFDQLVVFPEPQRQTGGHHREPSPPWGQPSQSVPVESVSSVSGPRPPGRIPSDSQARPRRDLRMPLTYDDLAVPLATPHYVDQRFDAVAKPNPQGPPADVALRSAPKYQAMRVGDESASSLASRSPYQAFDDQPQSILNQTEPAPVRSNRSVEGTLVSGQSRSVETSPSDEPVRVRHWIRQPE